MSDFAKPEEAPATLPDCREQVCGVPVDRVDLAAAVNLIEDAIARRGKTLTVVCANAHTLAEADRDPALAQVFRNAGLVLPDGIGAAAASWIGGGVLRSKVGGPDVLDALTRRAGPDRPLRYFFFGTTPTTLDRIRRRIDREFPHIRVVGAWAPPMGPISAEENARVLQAVRASRADVLWVGLSAPKQEKWIAAHADRLDVPVALAVGGAFDFFCGNKRRPRWAVRGGLFWAYRLLTEPRRLGARYMVGLPQFGVVALRHGLRTRHAAARSPTRR